MSEPRTRKPKLALSPNIFRFTGDSQPAGGYHIQDELILSEDSLPDRPRDVLH